MIKTHPLKLVFQFSSLSLIQSVLLFVFFHFLTQRFVLSVVFNGIKIVFPQLIFFSLFLLSFKGSRVLCSLMHSQLYFFLHLPRQSLLLSFRIHNLLSLELKSLLFLLNNLISDDLAFDLFLARFNPHLYQLLLLPVL